MLEITVREGFSEEVTFKRALQGKEGLREKSFRLGKQYVPRP